MTRIKSEPPAVVHSLAELFAIAHAMESDAASQYAETARLLRQRGGGPLGDLFEQLAAAAMERVKQIEERARTRGGVPQVDWTPPWPVPDTFDMRPEEAGQSRMLTPYTALAAAVHREERAFAFWSYVSAHAERADVRNTAEMMAHEELQQVSLLRRERRKAFHDERQGRGSTEPSVTTLQDLAILERGLATQFESRAAAFPTATVEWRALASQAGTMADRLMQVQADFSLPGGIPDFHDDVLAQAEFLVDAYLRIADFGKDENLVSAAQELAAQAISRVAKLRLHSQ